jgi:hypothetical protein
MTGSAISTRPYPWGKPDAISTSAAKNLEAAGLPGDPEEMCLAVEEEEHFAKLFDDAMDLAEKNDRSARAAGDDTRPLFGTLQAPFVGYAGRISVFQSQKGAQVEQRSGLV